MARLSVGNNRKYTGRGSVTAWEGRDDVEGGRFMGLPSMATTPKTNKLTK
jgi:hypothetical protein